MEDIFGADVDFAQLVKIHTSPTNDEARRYSPRRLPRRRRVAGHR